MQTWQLNIISTLAVLYHHKKDPLLYITHINKCVCKQTKIKVNVKSKEKYLVCFYSFPMYTFITLDPQLRVKYCDAFIIFRVKFKFSVINAAYHFIVHPKSQ